MLWNVPVGFRSVQSERDSRTATGELGDRRRPRTPGRAEVVPAESLGEPCGREGYVGRSGKKSQRFSAVPADVSNHGANSWVAGFALDFRLPGRNAKNRPDSLQCTAVTYSLCLFNRAWPLLTSEEKPCQSIFTCAGQCHTGDGDNGKKENETTMHIEHPRQNTPTSAKEMIVKDVRMGSKNRIRRPQWHKKNDSSSKCALVQESVLWCKDLRGAVGPRQGVEAASSRARSRDTTRVRLVPPLRYLRQSAGQRYPAPELFGELIRDWAAVQMAL
jgi:hypothetical protein